MIDAILMMPAWLLSMVGGALAGLVGIGLGLLLRDIRPGFARYLPIGLFVIGYAAADRYVVPGLLGSDMAICANATETAKQLGVARAGSRPDPLTSFVATTADCTARVIESRYAAEAGRQSLDPAGLAAVQLAFNADTCGDPHLRRLIAAGWTVENVYEFRSGQPVVISAGC